MPERRFCDSCGNELSPNARFCGSCGKPVGPSPSATPQVEMLRNENDGRFAPVQEIALGRFDQSKQAAKSKDLLNLARKIIIASAGVGLNAAGLAVCGPFVWPFFAAVLTPVIQELQQKYPSLSLQNKDISKKDADGGANALADDAHLTHILESAFEREFQTLEQGQEKILALLVRQDETLDLIKEVGELAQQTSNKEFAAINMKLDLIAEMGQRVPSQPTLTLNEILVEARALQLEAVQYIESGQLSTARLRLTAARGLTADGLRRHPFDSHLITLRGFVEKTESQICEAEGDALGESAAISECAEYFGAAMKLDPEDILAKNGLVDLYILREDYDAAIAFGRILARDAPEFTEAAWDFAIALERKIEQTGPDSDLLEELVSTYTRLVPLLSVARTGFSAWDLAYVEKRLDELKRELDNISA
jgi:hypothetical protein